MTDSDVNVELREDAKPRPAKTKAKSNGHDKPAVKAAGKVKAKKAGKVAAKGRPAHKVTAKAAKAPVKAKVAKAKAASADLDQFGFRKGSIKSKAVAMYARKGGATLAEVKEAVGVVQLNCLTQLKNNGYTVEQNKEKKIKDQRAVTRYRLIAK